DPDQPLEPQRVLPELQRPSAEQLPALLEGSFAAHAALATAGSWELGQGDVHSLALATETEIAAIDLSALDDVAEEALATWLADLMCRPDQRTTDLAGLALRHLQEDLQVGTAAAQQALDLDAGDSDAEQLGRSADAVARLETHLRAELDERGAAEMHDELELP